MFGCYLFMLYMCLNLQISPFTIQCFICENLVNMQCILGSIGVLFAWNLTAYDL
jgi:hypothetical protein